MKISTFAGIRPTHTDIIHILLVLFMIVGPGCIWITKGIPLIGAYTIDATLPTGGTNFQSFTAFANSINMNGVSGNVTTTVTPGSGPYLEQVIFSNIAGAGPLATITLEGSGESISAITTTTDRHVIRLSNCQYFTINNLNINWNPLSTGGFYGIHIFSTGNHITISNCSVDLTGTTSTLYGAFIASGSETSILVTGDFHYITISGNSTNGGGYGASVFGLVSNLASHIVISGNNFWNAHSNGVYLRETDGAVISGNYFDKTTSVVTSCNAIQIAQAANINARIYNNDITVSQTANGNQTIRGIYLFNGTGHKVYNNLIHNIQLTSGEYTAIEIRTSNTSPEIYFNTISLDNPVTSTADLFGIKEELSNTTSILRNNMISISQITSGTRSGLVLGSTAVVTSAFNSNYNDIWVPGGNVAQKGTTSSVTYYSTLPDWQSVSGQDANSISSDPVFVSLLYSQPTNGLIDNTGIQITGIPTDITGALRGNPPDIGAYEFSAAPPASPDTIYGDTLVCENSTGMSYYIMPVTGASSYTWTVTGATLASGQGTSTILVNFSGITCTISVVSVNNSGSSNPVSISITIIPYPIVNFTITPEIVCLYQAPFTLSGGTPLNGTYSGPGVSNNVFSPVLAGIGSHPLKYAYEAGTGCTASATDTISVEICPGIIEITGETHDLIVYPNPCSFQCTVIAPGITSLSLVNLYDLYGRIVKEFFVETSKFMLPCNELPRGVYILEIITGSGERLTKRIEI